MYEEMFGDHLLHRSSLRVLDAPGGNLDVILPAVSRIPAQSSRAARAYELVQSLQSRFVQQLNDVSQRQGAGVPMQAVEWLRDGGAHGGGIRYEARDERVFNRGSVNVSQVHYDDTPSRKLGSASAISTIIHPVNPQAPSIHMHYSWTEMKDQRGYWRMMADLNPAILHEADRDDFAAMLRKVAPKVVDEALAQGDRYFKIPALGRHRGVVHFYLENYHTAEPDADEALARKVGEAAIDWYTARLEDAIQRPIGEGDREQQIAYHTLYLFQVLTLDRGTTSGLLIHNQNDVGIMGSLPSHVDVRLLRDWQTKVPPPQTNLVANLVAALGEGPIVLVDEPCKQRLAEAVRAHYTAHPEALELQASGNTTPPTVDNHR